MVRKMIAFAAAAAMAPMAVSLAPAAIAAPASSPDLQKVGAHLKAANTMTADFTQSDRAGQTLTGKLTLKRPGRIRFQYQKGVPLLIVADGKALTMIDYEVNQVQRWPIANSPLSALLDPDNNLAKFGKVIEASGIWAAEHDFRAQRRCTRRFDARQLGGAGFAEQPHHGPAAQPEVQRAGIGQQFPLERPAQKIPPIERAPYATGGGRSASMTASFILRSSDWR